MRKQGDLPGRDGESYSRYQCDLCHRSKPLTELRQCVICGRWACNNCWNDEYYICNSCRGIISLHQVCTPVENMDAPGDSPVSGEESPVE